VSRTRRVGPVEGFWSTVDEWAADVVDPSKVHGWWASRARLDAECGPFLDVLDEVPGRTRPLAGAIGATGIAVADDETNRALVLDRELEHRRVTAGRRYRWNGPAMTPVAVEVHTTEDNGIVEAWWEDVWVAWPTIRLGRGDDDGPKPASPRRATATAQINRLFVALGLDPLGRPV
jgi:hypothetical protein